MKSCYKLMLISLSLFAALTFSAETYAQACGSGDGGTVCLFATGNQGNITLTWSVSGSISSVQVYRNITSSTSGRSRLASVSASTTSYVDSSAASGAQYWYWIKFTASSTAYNSNEATAMRSPYPSYNTSAIATDSSGMATAATVASKIKLGWNLGNAMESVASTPSASTETSWGNPTITSTFIQLVKNSGFNAIRLPVSWDIHANQTTELIDANWLARVKQVVQYCVDNGLYVIVNIHWDNGWLESNVTTAAQASVNNKQKALWEQIATALRGFDQHVLFASANEPAVTDATGMAVLLSYHQTFINAVRSTGGKNAYRVLIVQGPSTDVDTTNSLMNTLPGDTVSGYRMAEVHFYSPWNFDGLTSDQSWGNQFFYWGANYHSTTDTAHNPTWGEESYMQGEFAKMKTQFVNNGIPVIIGEFAAMRRSTELSSSALTLHLTGRAYYHQYLAQQALAYGLVPFYWDNGSLANFGDGIFNRTSNTIDDSQTLSALKTGAGL